jgi:hypothetical protein
MSFPVKFRDDGLFLLQVRPTHATPVRASCSDAKFIERALNRGLGNQGGCNMMNDLHYYGHWGPLLHAAKRQGCSPLSAGMAVVIEEPTMMVSLQLERNELGRTSHLQSLRINNDCQSGKT